jgi:type IV pilus assembly protein PilF
LCPPAFPAISVFALGSSWVDARRFAVVVWIAASSCRHTPTEKEQQGAEIHYNLGVNAQQAGDMRGALAEFETALSLDPGFAEAHNAFALLLSNAFGKTDEAIAHFQRALQLRPGFSEAKVNLGVLLSQQGRYDEAIKLFEEALNDMRYATPYFAEGNLGWALYKKGDSRMAIDHIRAAVTIEPKFCQGYRNLGIIESESGNLQEACRYFGSYRERCPEIAEAYYREGSCLAKLGQREAARQALSICQSKSASPSLKSDCRHLMEQLH